MRMAVQARPGCSSSTLFPFVFRGLLVSLFKLTIGKKDALTMKGLLGKLDE